MYLNVLGILFVLTIIRNAQTLEKPLPYKLKTKPDKEPKPETDNKKQSSGSKNKQWTFEDFVKKFEPATVWEQIDKQRKYNGLTITDEEQSEMMFQGMDPTDELMEFNVENGDAKIILEQDGRRGWKPPKWVNWYDQDYFFLRRRMYELMKQAIYQTRQKMVIMQLYREKYSNSSLYKMGFMFNKADNAAKTFGKFSYRAFRGCLLSRENVLFRVSVFDLLSSNERQLFLWFNVEILVDLIVKNDEICKEIFKNFTLGRAQKFDQLFID